MDSLSQQFPEGNAEVATTANGSPPTELPTIPMDVIPLLTHYLSGFMSGRLHMTSKDINQMRTFLGRSLRVQDLDPCLHGSAAGSWSDYPLHRIVPTSDTFNIRALGSFTYQCKLSMMSGVMAFVLSSHNVCEILKQAVNLRYLECELFPLVSDFARTLEIPNLVHLKVTSEHNYSGYRYTVGPESDAYLLAPKLKVIDLSKCPRPFTPMRNYRTLEAVLGIALFNCDVLVAPDGARFPQLKTLMLGNIPTDQVPSSLTSSLIKYYQCLETIGANSVVMGSTSMTTLCEVSAELKNLKVINLVVNWFVGAVSTTTNCLDLLKDHTAHLNLRIHYGSVIWPPGSISREPIKVYLYANISSLSLVNGTFELVCVETPGRKALANLTLYQCNVLLTNSQSHKYTLDAVELVDRPPSDSLFPNLRRFLLQDSVFHSRLITGTDTHPLIVHKQAVGITHNFAIAAGKWNYLGMPFPLYHILRAPLLEECTLVSCCDVSQFATYIQYVGNSNIARLFPRLMTQFVPSHCCVRPGVCPGLSGDIGREVPCAKQVNKIVHHAALTDLPDRVTVMGDDNDTTSDDDDGYPSDGDTVIDLD